MDERLEKAIQHVNYKQTVIRQRENIKARFAADLVYAHNGGVFTVGPSLISFVETLLRQGHEDAVLIDDRQNPIMVAALSDFLAAVISVYVEAANEFYSDYERLRKARTTKSAAEV